MPRRSKAVATDEIGIKTDPFAMIPTWVLWGPFSKGAIQTFGTIARYTQLEKGCIVSRETIAYHLGTKRLATVTEYLNELIDGGAIKVTERWDRYGRTTNQIEIVKHRPEGIEVRDNPPKLTRRSVRHGGPSTTEESTLERTDPVRSSVQTPYAVAYGSYSKVSESKRNESLCSPSLEESPEPVVTFAADAASEEDEVIDAEVIEEPRLSLVPQVVQADPFDEFWKAYPRKTAKAQARTAFKKAVKRGASPEQIIAALHAHLPELTSRDPQYQPYASTWLNGERYLDEPETTRRQQPGRRETANTVGLETLYAANEYLKQMDAANATPDYAAIMRGTN